MESLLLAIEGATSVRAAPPGEFDPRRRGASRAEFVESDPGSLRQLRDCLAIDPGSLEQRYAFMTPGEIALHFLRGHALLASVAYIRPDFVRWSGWPGDARLQRPAELAAWLAARGWRAPTP